MPERPFIVRALIQVKLIAVDEEDARQQLESTSNWEDWEVDAVTYIGLEPIRQEEGKSNEVRSRI